MRGRIFLIPFFALTWGIAYIIQFVFPRKRYSTHPRSFRALLKWTLTRQPEPWPRCVEYPSHTLPQSNKGITATFINHSTVLIQTPHLTLLTDPIFSMRCSPLPLSGTKRIHAPGIPLRDLPQVDVILLSHNHYDHMDIPTLRQLGNPLILTGLGNKKYLEKKGFTHVHELDWWQSIPLHKHTFTFVPSRHFSARNLVDQDTTLWGGFVVETEEGPLYFAGDTAFGPHFNEIRNRWGSPRLALLPIGAYLPRWFMQPVHMNPEEAVQAHLALGAHKSLAIHHGTFPLADESSTTQKADFQEALHKYTIPSDTFWILEPGESRTC